MAAPDPFVDPEAGRCAPEPSEDGWDLAQRRHHLARHGLIPWVPDIGPGLVIGRSFEGHGWCPRRRLILSEVSQRRRSEE